MVLRFGSIINQSINQSMFDCVGLNKFKKKFPLINQSIRNPSIIFTNVTISNCDNRKQKTKTNFI